MKYLLFAIDTSCGAKGGAHDFLGFVSCRDEMLSLLHDSGYNLVQIVDPTSMLILQEFQTWPPPPWKTIQKNTYEIGGGDFTTYTSEEP